MWGIKYDPLGDENILCNFYVYHTKNILTHSRQECIKNILMKGYFWKYYRQWEKWTNLEQARMCRCTEDWADMWDREPVSIL